MKRFSVSLVAGQLPFVFGEKIAWLVFPFSGNTNLFSCFAERLLQALAADLEQRKGDVTAAVEAGQRLASEFLEDPEVTEDQVRELQERWDALNSHLSEQQARVAEAEEAAAAFESDFAAMDSWLDSALAHLSAMDPVSHDDIDVLKKQDEEMNVRDDVDFTLCCQAAG